MGLRGAGRSSDNRADRSVFERDSDGLARNALTFAIADSICHTTADDRADDDHATARDAPTDTDCLGR